MEVGVIQDHNIVLSGVETLGPVIALDSYQDTI